MGQLQRDATKATAALAAEHERQTAVSAAEAAERTARSIEWSYDTILSYPGAAAAGAEVAAAFAAFDAAAVAGLGEAAYLRIASTMAEANGLGEGLTRARNTLRAAGLLPPGRANNLDPVGLYAPFPRTGLPPFGELVESAIAAARTKAERMAAFTADPGSFTGTSTEAMRRGVLADEFTLNDEMELMLGLRAQHPAHFAERIPADQQAQVSAYASCREAAGFAGPLPKASIPVAWSQAAGFPTVREASERWTLNR